MGVQFLQGLIFESFHFGRMWWFLKHSILRVHFGRVEWTWKDLSLDKFLFGKVWGTGNDWLWILFILNFVDLKGQIYDNFHFGGCGLLETLDDFYFGREWWSWRNWFWIIFTLGKCSSLQSTHFELLADFAFQSTAYRIADYHLPLCIYVCMLLCF